MEKKSKGGRPKGTLKRTSYSTKLTDKAKKTLEAYKSIGITGNDIIECSLELFFDYLNPAILNKYKSGELRREDLKYLSLNNLPEENIYPKTEVSAYSAQNKISGYAENEIPEFSINEVSGFQNKINNLISTDDIL